MVEGRTGSVQGGARRALGRIQDHGYHTRWVRMIRLLILQDHLTGYVFSSLAEYSPPITDALLPLSCSLAHARHPRRSHAVLTWNPLFGSAGLRLCTSTMIQIIQPINRSIWAKLNPRITGDHWQTFA